jgi:hypothetical protein
VQPERLRASLSVRISGAARRAGVGGDPGLCGAVGAEMNQERLEEIKRIYDSSGRGLMWDTIRELVAEVEWLADNLQASVELTAIREDQLQGEFKEIERLQAELSGLAALREAVEEALDAYDDAEGIDDIGGAMERLQEALRAATEANR